MLVALASPLMASAAVVEQQLRLQVPAAHRAVWLEAERSTWQPWLEDQAGFLGRDLYWDPERRRVCRSVGPAAASGKRYPMPKSNAFKRRSMLR